MEQEQLIDAAMEMLGYLRGDEEFEDEHDLEQACEEWELIINQAGAYRD